MDNHLDIEALEALLGLVDKGVLESFSFENGKILMKPTKEMKEYAKQNLQPLPLYPINYQD